MIKAKPLSLAQKLKNIVDICEGADALIDAQILIKKGALDTGKENDGIEPGVVRKILARRRRIAKDPAETTRLEDLMTDYQFMLGEGREDTRPWTQADDEISRVMALTNTSRPPKIEAIKKALGCSQGKAHKLRSIVAVRLAKKSSSSSTPREHEHLPERDESTAAPSAAPTALTPFSASPDDGVGAGTHSDREADTSAADAGRPSPPSDPADMGNPMSVNPGPPPERASLVTYGGQGTHPGTNSTRAENAPVEFFAESANNESCGPCPVSAGSVAPGNDGNGLRTKGKAEPLADSPREHSLAGCDGVLAGQVTTSQCEDRASPGPQDTPAEPFMDPRIGIIADAPAEQDDLAIPALLKREKGVGV